MGTPRAPHRTASPAGMWPFAADSARATSDPLAGSFYQAYGPWEMYKRAIFDSTLPRP